jgi:hypothetical protein
MTRPFVPIVLCALLALGVAPVQAAAQDAERPPKELWDKFPLEPSATPAATPAAATPATPSPRVVEVPADDGMAPGALIALMVAAAGIGGIAARVAVRQLPRRAKSAVDRAEAPQPERTPEERAAPEPARDAPAPARDAPPPAAAPRNAKAAPAPNGNAAPPRDAKAAPSRSAKAAPEPARDAPPPAARPRDAKPASPANAEAAPPRRAPAAPPRDEKPAPAKRATPARRPKPVRSQRSSQPPRAPATPARSPTGRFVPSQPRRASDRCSIKLTKRPPLGRFVAVGDEAGQALARSPVFKLRRDTDDTGPTPPEALRELVDELLAAGWRKTGAGRAPWELRFERVPRGAVTPRASPPRA